MSFRSSVMLLVVALLALVSVPARALATSEHTCASGDFAAPAAPSRPAHDAHATHRATSSGAVAEAAASTDTGAVVSADQRCSHCAHPQCATSQHCAASAPAALTSRVSWLISTSKSRPPAPGAPARPISVNLTPPIPPPQTIL